MKSTTEKQEQKIVNDPKSKGVHDPLPGLEDSRNRAMSAAYAASDMKALDIAVLQMIPLVSFTDFFVICSGTSGQHVKAVADNIEQILAKEGKKPKSIEGKSNASWILMDYGDVVVHIFMQEEREFYGLDKLWMDAPRVEIDEDTPFVGGKDQRALDS